MRDTTPFKPPKTGKLDETERVRYNISNCMEVLCPAIITKGNIR
jgi:hypothetical protein